MPRGVKGSAIPSDPRTCTGCLEDKPLSEFNKDKSRINGYANRCRDCRKAEMKAIPANKVLDYRKKAKYGISQAEGDAVFMVQGNVCALCQGDDPRSKLGWHTDHNHGNGEIRGIICYPCNALVGYIDKGWTMPDPVALEAYRTVREFLK